MRLEIRTNPGLVVAILLSSQVLVSAQSGEPNLDTVQIVSITPTDAVEVRMGQRVRFEVTVHYSLRSEDRAILAVYAERYPADSCNDAGTHQTEGGSLAQVKRGEGELKVAFYWQEETGRHTKVPHGPGSLAFGTNLWTDLNGRPVKPGIRRFERSFCRPIER
jgi:hypothetical protein